MGIAVLEAMAARLPVVITEGCEFPEVSESGAGFVVEADEARVAEAIGRLLSDAALCEHMGHTGEQTCCRTLYLEDQRDSNGQTV